MNVLSHISRNSLGHVVTAEGFLVGISLVFFSSVEQNESQIIIFLPLV